MALVVGMSGNAFAHVTVKPSEVVTAGYQTFTVNVPNEKDISTTSVKVVIPESVARVTPTQKAGWQVTTETQGEGETAKTTSVTWAGGAIGKGLRDEFTFSAKVPEKATELQWKAYQTYEDGTVVAWDQEEEKGGHGHGDGNSGPFSVTEVVSETEHEQEVKAAEKAAAEARDLAGLSLMIGIAGLLVGLIAVFFATRKK